MAKIQFYEQGTSGLKAFTGFIEEAYNTELRWPSVQPLYSRMRRSDPEMTAVRNVFTTLARSVSFRWEGPDTPTAGDSEALDFANTIWEDIEGGQGDFLETLVSQVPFFGWGWWEVLPGMRDPKWSAPGEDDWRSQYDDKHIGIRRLAWRDTSSFYQWDLDALTGRLRGMVQQDWPNPPVMLPIENSLHITLGDAHNPEGLSPLESVWRLERIKYGLEVIQGIGFEHAAGYLDVMAEEKLSASDQAAIKTAARAIMTAQEGNYAAWPKGVTGELKDVPFSAAPAILEAIKYFGILKLTVFNAQWMALSATTGSGSFAAMNDSSNMFVMTYNAMLEGFARQMDAQIGRRLFKWNAFPGMTQRPKLKIDPVNKLSLAELAAILGPLKNTITLGDEDAKAIRKQTGFLPEALPEQEEIAEDPAPDDTDQTGAVDEDGNAVEDEGEGDTDQADSQATPEQVQQSLNKWRAWTRRFDPRTWKTLNRGVK
jgi:hypothetical protein